MPSPRPDPERPGHYKTMLAEVADINLNGPGAAPDAYLPLPLRKTTM